MGTPPQLPPGDDLQRDLRFMVGELTQRVRQLEQTNRANVEIIARLRDWVMSTSNIEKAVEKNTNDLNAIGKRLNDDLHGLELKLGKDLTEVKDKDLTNLKKFAHTATTIGIVVLSLMGIAATFLGWAFHHFIEPHIVWR
jgi:hypothetical protein